MYLYTIFEKLTGQIVLDELYPKPNQRICNELAKYNNFEHFNIFAGSHLNKLIDENVRVAVRHALRMLDECCFNCSGNHNLWTVAGGYATYILNNTNSYNDVDIFVYCNGTLTQVPIFDETESGVNIFRNVASLTYASVRTQLIQVNFDVNVKNFNVFYDLMASYILSKFDLPICRVAMNFPLDESSDEIYVLDLSSVSTYDDDVKPHRVQKYNTRTEKNVKKMVPSLKLLATRALFDMK
ncbi:Glucan 1,3-beta-glucosidase I/II [Frankliniella fusca]|uniref:Glucan 1,3-beta-glucosidase I/II n=1 Tax=Frankliniella fusca TaxID=407009 RepID=A0AAE1LUY3_9NEOP|nr:Glucan 1,3-beta-glucosidase I/II [Frankliniella fusca]